MVGMNTAGLVEAVSRSLRLCLRRRPLGHPGIPGEARQYEYEHQHLGANALQRWVNAEPVDLRGIEGGRIEPARLLQCRDAFARQHDREYRHERRTS